MFEEAEKNGLRFECSSCGRCCGGAPGYVWLTKMDIDSLSSFFGLPADEFIQAYCRKIKTDDGYAISLRENRDFSCIFLCDKGCVAYEHRPLQCSTYPFWDEILASADIWQDESQRCPGINAGRIHAPDEILEQIVSRRTNPRIELHPDKEFN